MTRKSHPQCAVCNARHAYREQLRARWRSLGLCPRCGAPRRKFVACQPCREKNAANKRARKQAA